MKKALLCILVVIVALALACLCLSVCGRSACPLAASRQATSRENSVWFPVAGGYVNLSRVSVIRSTGRLVLTTTKNVEKKDLLGRAKVVPEKTVVAKLLDGPITEASIAAAKEALAGASGWRVAEGGAQLRLDDVTVPFAPIPAKADADALSALLDSWLLQSRAVDAVVK